MRVIPALEPSGRTDHLYQQFLEVLENQGFKGELRQDYGTRLVTSTDNSIYQVMPQAVIFPKDTDDLKLVLELSSEDRFQKISLAPRGGGTGTNGQSLTEGVIVDCSRHMNQILELNLDQGWVRVQPGVVLDQLNDFLMPHGVFFAPNVSPSSRATLGGMINTDACGKGSRIYGRTSNHILELNCVLSNGESMCSVLINQDSVEEYKQMTGIQGEIYRTVDEVVRSRKKLIHDTFPRLSRFMTGYNLAGVLNADESTFNLNALLSGSEGTLAFVSEARLRLTRIPRERLLLVVHYGSFDDALRDASRLVESDPAAIETLDEKILTLAKKDEIYPRVQKWVEDPEGRPTRTINLIEFSGDEITELEKKIHPICEEILKKRDTPGEAHGFFITDKAREISELWNLRKKGVGLLGNLPGERKPVAFVEDTAVPPEHLADYIREFRALLDRYGIEYGMYGHVDVGCLHVRPALDLKNPEEEGWVRDISDEVRNLVKKYQGVMWAEHGRGFRSEYTEDFFGKELYRELRRIKEAFDPLNRLNPGKIVTPLSHSENVVKVEGPLRGQRDRQVDPKLREAFRPALECNGNGACFDYAPDHVMCPSSRITRDRIHSPKGRAGMLREWLRLLSLQAPQQASHWAIPFLEKNPAPETRSSLGFQPLIRFFRSNQQRSKKDFSHDVYDAMNGCLACKACATQCPIHVDVPSFRSRFLQLYHSRYRRPIKDYMVGSTEKTGRILARFPRMANALLNSPFSQKLIQGTGMVDVPRFSPLSLQHLQSEEQIPTWNVEQSASHSNEEISDKVILVQDAFTSFYEAGLIIEFYHLLKKLGMKVFLTSFYENGKPLHVKGFLKQFRKVAEKQESRLKELCASGIPLVGIEPSIVLTYRDEYPEILMKEKLDFTVMLPQEFLVEQLERLKAHRPAVSQKYSFLGHCMEKTGASASKNQWLDVFQAMGLELKWIEVGCCGMAGTYGHELEHLEESKGIYEMSWKAHCRGKNGLEDTLLVSGFSCRSQVQRFEKFRPLHPLQALNRLI
ncbi:MAG: FAD-binding and (Fe-S)-binding domain-containing protein [SAR324 cluster bacterium]|jgi:FAD/FMN-containing dehydrogenase/Fe-S oxidoreductase|nr:glycerol-3-phosphate dehydrogenase [Deltaproteobacteria bacterium]MDP6245640.1 FAD-binding and (Fe-S)-binding domain-containing protein [SAR324 cluster bacterium]MBI13406.1 glycerol-3-phosphate dehydrogenase [Deltaproteobacteria bacterium]MDP7139311.1 FAD-binding and (Fe-S)-binding domain-containing protein [SAR324 cluster bacterium]MDP7334798.1 FAD-binding and (Fe-S)-binding domain-containing protein [SAR324 cluster bacterium]|tara:strand:+ start:2515 stop:5598 length:3084 start_codon:yes stop_codon:yes gene_type:complete